MKNIAPECRPYILATRVALLLIFIILALLVKIAWKRRKLGREALP